MKKILLFNPPSGSVKFSRDYFCSKALKGGYVEHSIDLLILSGILYPSFDIAVLDATVDNLNENKCMKIISQHAPDIIIFITGYASFYKDFPLLKKIKHNNPEIIFIGIGNIFLEIPLNNQNKWLDAILFDFTTDDIVHYINNNLSSVKNMIYRQEERIIDTRSGKYNNQEFEIPIPRHELFLSKRYDFPFAKYLPFTTILTDYGCPFSCSFCIYSTLGIKYRKLDNVLKELEYINNLGIKELFIKDQTFGWDRDRVIKLCSKMIEQKWNFSWTAFTKVDLIDNEVLSIMKNAGCHTLIMGVESANEEILEKYKKYLKKEQVFRAFKLCKSFGIETVGTFIIGFPGEVKKSIINTINFATELNCDFASFNCFTPRLSIAPSSRGKEINDYLDKPQIDQSGIVSVSGNGVLTGKKISKLLKYAIIHFYLRPKYLLHQLTKIKSPQKLRRFIKIGANLIIDYFIRKNKKRE
ncbi:MAG: hypothetical protein DRP84_02105 [Spirochaetes bacterium]|nr:MAG: hypothetical protein DRP84_02105 [Spirochaetota bacterium]